MAIYIWDPANTTGKATPLHIATLGIYPGHVPLTVGTDGYIKPLLTDINLQFGGEADTSVGIDEH